MAGIESRLNDERLVLSKLEKEQAIIKHGLMIDVAKALSGEYAQHLETAVTVLFKLMALDNIIASEGVNLGHVSGELLQSNWLLTVPITPVMKSSDTYPVVRHFLSTNRHNLNLNSSTKEIKSDLETMGMRL